MPLEGIVSDAPQLKGPADRELWCSGVADAADATQRFGMAGRTWRVQDLLPMVIFDDIMLLLNDTVVSIYSHYMIVFVYLVLLR